MLSVMPCPLSGVGQLRCHGDEWGGKAGGGCPYASCPYLGFGAAFLTSAAWGCSCKVHKELTEVN